LAATDAQTGLLQEYVLNVCQMINLL